MLFVRFCFPLVKALGAEGEYTLVETAKMNNVDPEAWLTWVLQRLPDHKIRGCPRYLVQMLPNPLS